MECKDRDEQLLKREALICRNNIEFYKEKIKEDKVKFLQMDFESCKSSKSSILNQTITSAQLTVLIV